jgi:hypothetical protein
MPNASGDTCDDPATGAQQEEKKPTVTLANNFEEVKVTYTEYDDTGLSQGNVEYEWKVEEGVAGMVRGFISNLNPLN